MFLYFEHTYYICLKAVYQYDKKVIKLPGLFGESRVSWKEKQGLEFAFAGVRIFLKTTSMVVVVYKYIST